MNKKEPSKKEGLLILHFLVPYEKALLFVILFMSNQYIADKYVGVDPTRMAAQVVSGIMENNSVNLKELAEVMGHHSSDFTMNTYVEKKQPVFEGMREYQTGTADQWSRRQKKTLPPMGKCRIIIQIDICTESGNFEIGLISESK